MTVKIAINGYGRIGRNVLRALYESGRTDELQVVAINDLGDANSNAHLTKYDTAHGQFPYSVEARDDALVFLQRKSWQANTSMQAQKRW